MNEAMPMSLVDRVQGVLKLDVPTYEEIEADSTALPQAVIVVAVVSICWGIGLGSGGGFGALILGVFNAFLWWFVSSTVTFFVGTKAFGGQATWDQVLRVMGFAQAPGLVMVVALIPFVEILTTPVAVVWSLATAFVGVRQSLDLTSGKALATIAVCVALFFFLIMVPLTLLGFGLFALGGGWS